MRHDCVLIKLSFDLLTPGSRVGVVCRQNICDHVAAFVIPFNEIVLKKLNFDLLTPRVGEGGGGGCEQNICYHVATFLRGCIYSMTSCSNLKYCKHCSLS